MGQIMPLFVATTSADTLPKYRPSRVLPWSEAAPLW